MLNNNPFTQTNNINVSDKYSHIQTDVLEKVFLDNGLYCRDRVTARSRKRTGYQPHMSFWTSDALKIDSDNFVQIMLRNAHDGTSSLRLNLGVFRLVCDNGMVSGNVDYERRIRHVGDPMERVSSEIQYLLDRAPQVASQVQQLRQSKITDSQVASLTKAAFDIRLGDIKPYEIFVPAARRYQDAQADAWTRFNVIQEHLIKGGLSYTVLDENGRIEYKRTRKLGNINRITEANKQLWSSAESILDIAG